MPTAQQKPLNVDKAKASTNEQARPVPYLAGKTRVGVTWLTDAFGVKTQAVTTRIGKGQTATTGYKYYADLGALVCHGPVDAIETIYLNSDKVWTSGMTRGSEDYAEITIDSHGKMRLYWGTATQAVDTLMQASGFAHPPYKRQCYLRFDQLYFGINQTNAPNVELVLSRYPALDWFTAPLNINDDCNPIAILGEWLTNPIYGLGWPEDRLDVAGLNAVAAQLATEGIGLSPYITEQSSARELITSLLEYFDGYPIFTPEGKFSVGLVRSPNDVDALPEITAADLVKEPDLTPDGWSTAKTKTWVKFTDRDNEFLSSAVPYRDPVAASVMTDNTPQTLERPWVTKHGVAQLLVAAAGRAAAIPACTAKLSVRKSAAVQPGNLVRLNYPDLNITDLLLRISSYSTPSPGAQTVDLEATLDRSYLNDQFYIPPDDGTVTPTTLDPAPFVFTQLLEVPLGLIDTTVKGQGIQIAALVARPNSWTTGFNILLRQAGSLTQSQYTFPYLTIAVTGSTVTGDYPATPTVDEQIGVIVSFPAKTDTGLNPAGTDWGATLGGYVNNAKLLLQIEQEWLTPTDWLTLDDTHGRAYVVRGRINSRIVPHANGKAVHFFLTRYPQFTLTFTNLGTASDFAQRGLLLSSLTHTQPIDQEVGCLVSLNDPDIFLDEYTIEDGLSDDFLMFVNDEIISVIGAELVSSKLYRIFGIRGRFDTQPQSHGPGAEVYLVKNDALKRVTHSSFILGASVRLKLQPVVITKSLAIDQVTLTDALVLKNRQGLPFPPKNLAVFGDHSTPVYSHGQDIVVTWTPTTEKKGDFWARFGTPVTPTAKTILQVVAPGGATVVSTITVPAGTTTYTYPNATLVTKMGTEPTWFFVRAFQSYGTNKTSLHYTEITIRKI